jgi:DNA-binding protein
MSVRKVSDLVDRLLKLPQDSDIVFIVGCGRKHITAAVGEVELTNRVRGSNVVVEEVSEDTEQVVGIRW